MKHILVVDDDRSVLDVLTRALTGYRVLVARDPDEASASPPPRPPWTS